MIVTVTARSREELIEWLNAQHLQFDLIEGEHSGSHSLYGVTWEEADDACNDPEALGRIFGRR